MKVYLYKDKSEKLTVHHRPFTFDCEVTTDVEKSDRILIKPSDYINFINDINMKPYHHKGVVYVNDDNPSYLLRDKKVKKLIAQPLQKEDILKGYNAITIPLIMTDHLKIHLDDEFLDECRSQKKIYDYYFVGQFYGNRNKLLNFDEGNSFIKKTTSIYHLSEEDKIKTIKKFLLDLSKSKFGFAPRGLGSNSFRLYECLMVGTIPISTDVIEYPFTDKVDWDSFTVRGSLDNIDELIKKSKNIDYHKFRSSGIDFWDNYIKINKCYDKIKKIL
jgi:hypothetical protein